MATIHVEQNKRPWIWAVPLVVVGLGVFTWAVWPDSQAPDAQVAAVGTPGANGQPMGATGTSADATGANGNTTPGAPSGTAAERPLGTLFDLDNQGRLIVSGKTKESLDTVLSAYPKGPTQQEWNTIEDKLAKDLPKAALLEVMTLLQGMHQLNQSVAQLQAANPNAEAEGRSLELFAQLKALRRQQFPSQTAEALFGEEETWGGFMLGMQAIEANPKLNDEAKKQQITALLNTLPEAQRLQAKETLGLQ